MVSPKIAVVGIGATGSVLAAALLSKHPQTILVGRRLALGTTLKENGIKLSGVINTQVQVNNYISSISELKELAPNIIILCTKTFHLGCIIDELKDMITPGVKIISAQNGLGVEDLIADKCGDDAAFRMSINLGAAMKRPGEIETAFFNRPNHLGCVSEKNRDMGIEIARLLTACGLETEFVDDIKRFVWRKMIMKCTLASIGAVTDRTIKECLDFPPTREIADACFQEVLSVARALGYDFGDDYLTQALGYLEKVGAHKDSMCYDIENKTQTEIEFLGGKVVQYGRENGVETPYYATMTNLVRALEDTYLKR